MSASSQPEPTPAGQSNFSLAGWPGFPASAQRSGSAGVNPPTQKSARKKNKPAKRSGLQQPETHVSVKQVDTPQQSLPRSKAIEDSNPVVTNPHTSLIQSEGSQQAKKNPRTHKKNPPRDRSGSKRSSINTGPSDRESQNTSSKPDDVQSQQRQSLLIQGTALPSNALPVTSSGGSVRNFHQITNEVVGDIDRYMYKDAVGSAAHNTPVPTSIEFSDYSLTPSKPIEYTEQYMEELADLIPRFKDLTGEGYLLRNLGDKELQLKRRCANCNKFVSKAPGKENSTKKRPERLSPDNTTTKPAQISITGTTALETQNPAQPPARSGMKCQFHPGVVRQKFWSCCGEHMMKLGCTKAKDHESIRYRPGELEQEWLFHETPRMAQHARPAVAIDCEMGTSTSGTSVVIRVSLIDYFTGDTLLDQLVLPDVPMQHYNTRFSGVTSRMMVEARKQNKCLRGTNDARTKVWKFVNPETIVVGHSAHNDLKALRWIHFRVVDSFMLEPRPPPPETDKDKGKEKEKMEGDGNGEGLTTNTESMETARHNQIKDQTGREKSGIGEQGPQTAKQPATAAVTGSRQDESGDKPTEQKKAPPKRKGEGPRSLKTLARVKLGRAIQDPARVGHDSIEDAVASRDLVHWAILDRRHKAATEADFLLGVSRLGGVRLD